MWFNSVVQIVVELHIDPCGLFSPLPTISKVKDVVFENAVDRRSALRKNADVLLPFANEVRVVVDVNSFGILLAVKSVKVETHFLVLADVVTNHHVAIGPFHDAAEPVVVVTVVVLNESVDAIEVRIESAAINLAFANISISFVVLDPDAICLEAENAVPRVVTAAVGQNIVFVDGIFACSGNHIVPASSIDMVTTHVNLGPQIFGFDFITLKRDSCARRRIADPDATYFNDSIVGDTKIMKD